MPIKDGLLRISYPYSDTSRFKELLSIYVDEVNPLTNIRRRLLLSTKL